MHALFITFQLVADPKEAEDGNARYAEAVRGGAVPGFVAQSWLADGTTVGGFCLIENRLAADGYLEGMFADAVTRNPAVTDLRIERYDVDEALSAITNGLGAMTVSDRHERAQVEGMISARR